MGLIPLILLPFAQDNRGIGMQDLLAMKLGEALALCSLGAEVMEKSESALKTVMDSQDIQTRRQTFSDHTERTRSLAQELGVGDEAEQEAKHLNDRFREMSETIIDDQWDNPVHVLSWMSMAHGGTASTWAFLRGAAEKLGHDDLEVLSQEAQEFQEQGLSDAEDALAQLAEEQTDGGEDGEEE